MGGAGFVLGAGTGWYFNGPTGAIIGGGFGAVGGVAGVFVVPFVISVGGGTISVVATLAIINGAAGGAATMVTNFYENKPIFQDVRNSIFISGAAPVFTFDAPAAALMGAGPPTLEAVVAGVAFAVDTAAMAFGFTIYDQHESSIVPQPSNPQPPAPASSGSHSPAPHCPPAH